MRLALLFVLASCGGQGRAVPTPVEIDWPDAGGFPSVSDASLSEEPGAVEEPRGMDAGRLQEPPGSL